MSLVGRIIGRLIAVLIGYIAASVAAGATLVAALLGMAGIGIGWEPVQAGLPWLVFTAGLFASFISVLAFAPAVVAVLVAEVFGIRWMLYYLLAGGLTGALGYVAFTDFGLRAEAPPGTADELLLIVAAGLVAGLAYWLVAGRRAGLFEPAT